MKDKTVVMVVSMDTGWNFISCTMVDLPYIILLQVIYHIVIYAENGDITPKIANACTGSWGSWGGIETYIYTYTDNTTEEMANIIHKNLIKGTPLKDRGVKRENFHVLRETIMPAVLVECGFMDSREEAKLLMSEEYRKECATEIAQAICEIYGVDCIKEDNKIEQNKLTPIMGKTLASKYQMISYVLKNNPNPSLPQWQIDAFDNLKAKKVITDNNYSDRLNDNITIGECMALLDKVSNVVSDIVEDNILTDLINATERMYK